MSAPMNVSRCSQRRKSLLYNLLRAAYQEHQSSPDAYYQFLKPVIGGASAQDLIRFASNHPVMATDVFIDLNPDEVQKLSPQDLKDLLGVNLPDLNNLADQPVVKAWVQSHKQSEVQSLGLHLTAGIPDPPPHGFIHIPAAPQPSGRAATRMKDYTAQLFYCMLLPSALAVFL
ncbi:PREDICTED: mesothelin-like protein [Gavialis gangeticus]|uniref:mesothelin-like protein n=1 Tax=Gavialis gangeticus TaxID=94835 RepID=UPI00092F7D35|nr:PREDICTED: mesothelin-like protein [Gavialis gangeticus]